MTIMGVNQPNLNESIDSFVSSESFHMSEYLLPNTPLQDAPSSVQSNKNLQNVASGSSGSRPQYNASPEFSASPYNPVPVLSPMVGVPIQSPSGSGPHSSRPGSTNSGIGGPCASPYGQPICSPQFAPTQEQQQPNHVMGVHMTQQQPNHMVRVNMMQPNPQTMVSHTVQMGVPNMMNPANVRMGNPPMMHVPMHQAPMTRGPYTLNRMAQTVPLSRVNYCLKIFELNRRLQEHEAAQGEAWWNSFTTEFFEENATFSLYLDNGTNKYNLTRTLIPKFFKSFYDGGVVEMYFNLRKSEQRLHANSVILDSLYCTVETLYVVPIYTKVLCGGRLFLEFSTNEGMRIKAWHFHVREWQEQIPRDFVTMQAQQMNPETFSQLTTNITRQGFPSTVLNYLRMCRILQPMQQLMVMQQTTGMDPRACLNTSLLQKVPPEAPQPAPKQRKKRKTPAEKKGPTSRKKRSPEPKQPAFTTEQRSELMIVGEPSRTEDSTENDDERLITLIDSIQLPYNTR